MKIKNENHFVNKVMLENNLLIKMSLKLVSQLSMLLFYLKLYSCI